MMTNNKIALFKKLILTTTMLMGVGVFSIAQAEDNYQDKTRPRLIRVAPARKLMGKLAQLEELARQSHEAATKVKEKEQEEEKEADADLKITASIADYALHLPKGTAEKLANTVIQEKPMDVETIKTLAQKTTQEIHSLARAEEAEGTTVDTSFLGKMKRLFSCH